MNHAERSFFYGVNMEIWKYITGTNRQYSVSNLGSIRSHRHRFGRRKILKIRKPVITKGYQYIILYKNGIAKGYHVAHLVALMFIGKRPKGKVINHKDCNRANDNYKNLEYVTPKENARHAWDNNRCFPKRGSD